MRFPLFALALILSSPLGSRHAAAIETRIVDASSGALFDAIIDGFPGIGELDGEPDLTGNQLATAFKLAVTEERGIAEFPLAGLADISANDLQRAVLTFNIDDVLTTFGPGTDFSGKAAQTLLIHVYAGDGTIVLGDYKNVTGPAHVVDTTIHGRIDDASLRRTGPLVFEVDITADVRSLLSQATTFAGIVWRTNDTPTGTSLDNLGDGSVGPPGKDGARLPFLTFEIEAAVPSATPTATVPPATPTATATATPATQPDCAGDCDGSDDVTVDEIVALINIALGTVDIERCTAGDLDGSSSITVDEIVRALNRALDGCPS